MKAGIAGGGIMGLVMAYYLLQKGWKVTIFDPDDSQNCSRAAAGLLTPLGELDKCDWMVSQMGLDGLKTHWPEMISRLPEKVFFNHAGSLIISHRNDAADMHRYAQIMTEKSRHDAVVRWIDHHELVQLEPELHQFSGGYYLSDEGQIDSQQALKELKKYLIVHGVIWQPHAVSSFDGYVFDWMFDCRGLGAKTNITDLRGIRGELIWLRAPDVHLTRPVRLAHPRYAIYIVPRPDQVYLVGASEVEAEDYSAVSVQSMLEMLSAAYCVHPGFLEARILKSVTQCRPVLSSHAPRISVDGHVITVNGLYRHGFLIAPALAQEVTRYLESGSDDLSYADIWEIAA